MSVARLPETVETAPAEPPVCVIATPERPDRMPLPPQDARTDEHTPPVGARRRNQKHLMVPGSPRPQSRYSTSAEQVQKWVLSSLVIVTLGHLCAGIVVGAIFTPAARVEARVVLLVIAGIFGVLGVVGVLLIHKKPPVSPWLVTGFLPTLIGAWLMNWR